MSHKIKSLRLVLAILLWTLPVFESEALAKNGASVSETEVRKAIADMMHNPLGDSFVQDSKKVVLFGDESKKVGILVRPEFCKSDDPTGHKLEVLMLTYYMAGSEKYQLDHPNELNQNRKKAAVEAGIRSSLFIYDFVRKKQPDYQNPFYDKLQKLDQTGKLDKYVETALKSK